MQDFIAFTVLGLTGAAVYAIAASGLVVTYTTSGVFNIAAGAIGMLMAFVYWELTVEQGWSTLLAACFVALVVAPLFGAIVERTLIRRVAGSALVTTLVVTIGLMVGLMALAGIIWPTRLRRVQPFFPGEGVEVAGVLVTWHRVVAIGLAILIALALRALLYGTRIGIAMRGVVDSRELVALTGGRPGMASMLAWAIGSSLAALAGILFASEVAFTVDALYTIALLVPMFAAAVIGKLSSLPLTFLGAMIVGLVEQYGIGYLPLDRFQWLAQVRVALPVIVLFVALLIVPEARLRGARPLKGIKTRIPSLQHSLVAGLGLVAVAYVVSGLLHGVDLTDIGKGLAIAIVMLSLVPLTGYAGQISLCQMTFAGVGAWAMSKWGDDGSLLGLVVGVVVAAIIGAVVALPSLRLQGLYLALSTLAFAVAMDGMFFPQDDILSAGGIPVPRLFGIEDDRVFFTFTAGVFALLAVLVLVLRRGPFGRKLVALRDSPAACATLGLSVARTKLTVFALSAAMAAVGGALYGGMAVTVAPTDFQLFVSLPVLLLAVVGGIATVSGPLLGGVFYSALPLVAREIPALKNLALLAPGLAGIGLGRNEDGVTADVAANMEPILHRDRARPVSSVEQSDSDRLRDVLAPGTALGTPIDHQAERALDRALGIEEVTVGATDH